MKMARSARWEQPIGMVAAVLSIALSACRTHPAAAVDGGIYSIVSNSAKGTYGVVKVLKAEPGAVHVRIYAGEYLVRPSSVNPAELKVGTIEEGGMGHLPLSARVFAAWKPVLITTAGVERSELDGYEEWRKAGGALWDQ